MLLVSRIFHLTSSSFKNWILKYLTLAVVLYGYETWCLTWWQIEMFMNKALQRIFGPKKEEVIRRTGLIESLGKKELHIKYFEL